jgi:phosphoribosylglycinamide formyltransferase-1
MDQVPAQPDQPHAEFVGEELRPVRGSGDAAGASRGEPGVPHRFVWRDQEHEMVGVIESWKTSSPCRHGSGEMYLRRHWYRIQARPVATQARGRTVMTIYCDRQSRSRRRPTSRWWVYTVEP